MIKILALGSSIVAGPYDNIDTPYRADSPTAAHVPEGGWKSVALFNVPPRHGQRSQTPAEGVAWAVRAADYLPAGSVQIWNEGVGSGRSTSYATTGDNFIDAMYTRGFETLPNDITYAVFAIMTNDANIGIAPASWKANVETVIQYLNAKNIKTILVYDFLRVAANQQYYYDYLVEAQALVDTYNLPPILDIYTVSKDNYYLGAKSWFDADEIHPNVTGHQGVAKLFANYLATNHIVTDATAKRIIAHGETGAVVYCTVTREADGYILDGYSGEFAATSDYPYTFLQEHPIVKGRYEIAETRAVWSDGKYIVTVYKQAGTDPAPVVDSIIGTGEIMVENDTEVYPPVLSEIEGSTVLAKEATVEFIEKWVLNRLSITVNGDGTETVRLFDNDSSTVLKTWIWDPVTKTRAMAV